MITNPKQTAAVFGRLFNASDAQGLLALYEADGTGRYIIDLPSGAS